MTPTLEGFDHRRTELNSSIDSILSTARDGRVTKTKETQSIDFKEEAGRRNGPSIEPGQNKNSDAATKLADEVACMANSPEGGALLLGIEDRSGMIIGTELDIDWLRQSIYSRVDIAPDIIEKRAEGQRILAVFVAPSPEPVEDTSGRLRWRVGDACEPVDRSEWWQYQRSQAAYDPMAKSTTISIDQVRDGAIAYVRRQDTEFAEYTKEDLLRRIGAVDATGKLSQAGVLLFTSLRQTVVEFTVFDVHGGQVRNRVVPAPEGSGLEQLEQIENALSVINKNHTVSTGLSDQPVSEIPRSAVRESLLNAMIHRDWNRSEPIDIRWIELDSTMIVRSPGGFPPNINSGNVLSNRAARYPALADLYRAIRLVDKQGVGVDRMYQSMIAIGHRPPTIEEVAGPFVETTLVGGKPVIPVLELMSKIVPLGRQRDYRIAIILYLLFRRPFVTVDTVAKGLQSGNDAAISALEASLQTTVDGLPLITEHNGSWILGESARAILKQTPTSVTRPASYLSTDPVEMENAALLWLDEMGSIATSDLMALTGVSRGTAKNRLDDMASREIIRTVGAGRSTHYRPKDLKKSVKKSATTNKLVD